MTTVQKKGYFFLTPKLLERLLNFPAHHEVIGVEWEFERQLIKVFIRGKTLPTVAEGAVLPQVSLHIDSINQTGYFK